MATEKNSKMSENNNSSEKNEINEDSLKEIEHDLKKIEAERAEMRQFLVIKSTEQQKREGVERPVDTAYVENEDGRLVLKAVFDVHHFKPEEIHITIEGKELTMNAQGLDDRESAIYRKTMIRKMELPDNVDTESTKCEQTEDGILTVSMPFHIPPSDRRLSGPTAVPIINENGRRLIRLAVMIGPDFAMDDLNVEAEGHSLFIRASYEAEIGLEGAQTTRHELKKEFRLPEHIEVDEVSYELNKAGVLAVQILLKEGQLYQCQVTTEEIKTPTRKLQETSIDD